MSSLLYKPWLKENIQGLSQLPASAHMEQVLRWAEITYNIVVELSNHALRDKCMGNPTMIILSSPTIPL